MITYKRERRSVARFAVVAAVAEFEHLRAKLPVKSEKSARLCCGCCCWAAVAGRLALICEPVAPGELCAPPRLAGELSAATAAALMMLEPARRMDLFSDVTRKF